MRSKDVRGIAIAAAAIGAAIATELNKPAEERTWHGTIAGVVPYDFRRPTPERVREKLWNPAGNFWSPSVFGVGWAPNLGRLAAQTGLLGAVVPGTVLPDAVPSGAAEQTSSPALPASSGEGAGEEPVADGS
jgi:hypothetical protein